MQTRKYSFVSIAAVSLCLIGASCTPKSQTNSPATTNTSTNTPPINSRTTGSFTTTPVAPAAATVTLTAAGPDQPTVRVKVGERVEFRNGDTTAHWIASTPHPTHTDLPGFEKNMVAGGTYSYTFTRTGRFTYYDNSAPSDSRFNGLVIVE